MKSAFLLTKGLLCLDDKQNNTWLLLDMEFLFSYSTWHLTRSLRSLVTYRVKHSKRNSIYARLSIILYFPISSSIQKLSALSSIWIAVCLGTQKKNWFRGIVKCILKVTYSHFATLQFYHRLN